jgi:diaminohydroxyphosphoribosylaminopyrimidine deaminase/5-amino-6-(5-phosphoribosylamino)uracil reductase
MKTNRNKDIFYTKLAFHQAEINLGSTKANPSVGCVIVKDNAIIHSGHTSRNGMPHAEANALKKKLDYKNADLYVTLEPCSHFGKTPPCIKEIISKKIRRVIFSINDSDVRSKNKAEKKLKKNKIIVKKFIQKNFAKNFYESYFLKASNSLPFIDAKLAISKDYFTINKKDKWVTNLKSRNLGNYLRSKYDCLLTTSKTINNDNPLLNCRIEGLKKKTPSLIIIDRYFKINKNARVFKKNPRDIYILTNISNLSKENFLKKKGIKVIKISNKKYSDCNLIKIFMYIKKLGFSRIFVETGSTFLSQLLKKKLIKNLYLFKSSKNLLQNGANNSNLLQIKKIKTSSNNKVNVNLSGDNLYKVKL